MAEPANIAAFLTVEKAYPLEVWESPYPTPVKDELDSNHECLPTSTSFPFPGGLYPRLPTYHSFPLTTPRRITNCDCAGTIVAVGPAQTTHRIGDRVLGLAVGFPTKDPSRSAFQAYVKLPPPLVTKIPPATSFVDAVVLPLGTATAAAGLFEDYLLGLRLPSPSPPSRGLEAETGVAESEREAAAVVVWGAASSVGSCAVQLAVQAGYVVLATASPANFAYARDELGATAVFDYKSAGVVEEIVRVVEDGRYRLAGVFDTVGGGGAVEKCVEIAAMVRKGSRLVCTVRPLPDELSE
ncbi:Zinc-binding alcohol dehydrogenase domain-containing protein cipB [Lasiodiplodia hormozganensis]|uniref:Zinc-binding alcohol dehydrogenase domain-containing protein cipB n=1 Tax=Lasiodiplodia hormozganensis TaxID=869390 RepID=A0AA39YMJ7_9PEZI|nr:Zinc-binding alcohol dehydrogenase domain-containing protein cipB [Lasiodiplodia hormozganensis]